MTDNPEERGYMTPPRMFTERSPNDGRAVVINYTLAWGILVTLIVAFGTGVYTYATLESRVSTLEKLQIESDATLQSMETRIRPLEITAASIALLATQVDRQFTDLNRRLDRREDAVDKRDIP